MLNTSIIIPVYPIDDQVKQYFYECVDRIKRYTTDFQLIVVQNGGQPLDIDIDKATYLYKDKPMGFARALNLGLAMAEGDYLCLVSADVFVNDGWLGKLHKDLEDLGPGVVCPYDNGFPGITMDCGWGALWLTSRECFTKVGYHDETLNHRFSDQDWWIRFKRSGYSVIRTGSVQVIHDQMSTVGKMPEKSLWPVEESLIRQKWGVSTFAEYLQSNKNLL